jgi:transposase InsO family protein
MVDRAHPTDPCGQRSSLRQPEGARDVGADIKQIKTGEGWLHLAAVQDLFSRRIVGWSMASTCAPSSSSTRYG